MREIVRYTYFAFCFKLNISRNDPIGILMIMRKAKKNTCSIRLNGTLAENRIYELRIAYSGSIWTTADGLFRGQYVDTVTGEKKYVVKKGIVYLKFFSGEISD